MSLIFTSALASRPSFFHSERSEEPAFELALLFVILSAADPLPYR